MTAASASSSSSSTVLDDLCSPYLPFNATSSQWSDLTPTPQLESSSPMCPILYAHDYSSAMSLYRTLTASNSLSTLSSPLGGLELSPRALALTSHLIQLNPSHFSVWQYRANILLYSSELEQKRDEVLRAELGWLDALAHSNMKSYQVWQHRRIVVSALGDPSGELGFIEENLGRDAKNYHTWGYRQWILSHFGGLTLPATTTTTTTTTAAANAETERESTGSKGAAAFPELWEGEAAYIDRLLSHDVRNNSAWNHRWFLNFGRYGLTGTTASSSSTTAAALEHLDLAALQKAVQFEKAYAKASLASVPNNASAWTYLRALHTSLPAPLKTSLSDSLAWAKTLVSTAAEAKADPSVDVMGRSAVGALEWWLDCLAESAEGVEGRERRQEVVEEAEALVRRLCVADSVRKRFYAYRLKALRRTLHQS